MALIYPVQADAPEVGETLSPVDRQPASAADGPQLPVQVVEPDRSDLALQES